VGALPPEQRIQNPCLPVVASRPKSRPSSVSFILHPSSFILS
jgi:hypothetical protein